MGWPGQLNRDQGGSPTQAGTYFRDRRLPGVIALRQTGITDGKPTNPRIAASTTRVTSTGGADSASLNFTFEKFSGSEAAVGDLPQRAHMLFRRQLREVYDLMPELNVGPDRCFVPIKFLAIIIA